MLLILKCQNRGLQVRFLPPNEFLIISGRDDNFVVPISEQDVKSNVLLPDAARHHARMLLEDANKELELIDCFDRSTGRESLITGRPGIVSRIQFYQAAVAPHRILPNEILGDIFLHCLPGAIRIPPGLDLPAAPFNVTRVSSRWRRVALGTPRLWSDIHIEYFLPSRAVRDTEIARQLIARSGNSSVSLTVALRWDNSNSTVLSDALRQLIVPHATRLKDLVLCDYGLLSCKHLLSLLPDSFKFDTLETVNLIFSDGQSWDVEFEAVVFPPAPHLRKFAYKQKGSASFYPSRFHLPWSQLTDICIVRDMCALEAHLMLGHCVSLVNCSLVIWGTFNLLNDDERATLRKLHQLPPTVVPNLATLLLDHTLDFTEFLRNLVPPCLASFRFGKHCISQKQSSSWGSVFVPFLMRAPRLTRLSINQAVPEDTVESILCAVPSLTTLAFLYGDEIPKATLELIAHGDLVPKLRNLRCYVVYLDPFVDMLEARWAASHSFTGIDEVFIDLDTNGGGANYLSRNRVGGLKAAGRNITLRG